MKHTIEYKGYIGTVEFSEEDGAFFGKVIGIRSLISYEGTNEEALLEDFHEAVDDYLQICEDEGVEPEKSKIIDVSGIELTPGKPTECKGNGKHEGYECCCDECDYLEQCFPEPEFDEPEDLQIPDERSYITLQQLTEALSNDTVISLCDRTIEEVVYQGDILHLRTFWNDEEVCWICPTGFKAISVEIESRKKIGLPNRCLFNGKHTNYDKRCEDCEFSKYCYGDPSSEILII